MVRLRTAALVALALFLGGPAQALVVDPVTGGSGLFYWDEGVGDSVDFGAPPTGDDTLEITLTEDSTIGIFAVTDAPVAGDAFALVVDGFDEAWTSVVPADPGTGQLFEGRRLDLFLTAGTHTIDLTVTATATGFVSGAGYWEMSAAVPEPSSALLAGVGALVLGTSLRRRKPHS